MRWKKLTQGKRIIVRKIELYNRVTMKISFNRVWSGSNGKEIERKKKKRKAERVKKSWGRRFNFSPGISFSLLMKSCCPPSSPGPLLASQEISPDDDFVLTINKCVWCRRWKDLYWTFFVWNRCFRWRHLLSNEFLLQRWLMFENLQVEIPIPSWGKIKKGLLLGEILGAETQLPIFGGTQLDLRVHSFFF